MVDTQNRSRALNTAHSFIVQAPAGSGKTTLLTQRFLALLKTVNKPEEILAVTFTKKAAAEMYERVAHALDMSLVEEPSCDHEKSTYLLAKEAVQHLNKLGLDLNQIKNNLNIKTIDSLAYSIAYLLPLTSNNGCCLSVTDQHFSLYEEAVEELFNEYFTGKESYSYMSPIFETFNNDTTAIKNMFVSLLAKREQWLEGVFRANQYDIENEIGDASKLQRAIEKNIRKSLGSEVNFKEIVEYALYTLGYDESDVSAQNETFWSATCAIFLTEDNKVRKTLTKKQGFPAQSDFSSKADKQRAKEIKEKGISFLSQLSERVELTEELIAIKYLSKSKDGDKALQAVILKTLPTLVAILHNLFNAKNACDFTHVSLSALYGLGSEDDISDILLQKDMSITHLLVDEFQDTSYLQFNLLTKLTSGWEPDSNTVFIVGDPMQSIYQFRGSEVGLFLHVIENGFSELSLEYIQLQSNFRSSKALVDDFNQIFKAVFPSESSIVRSAITYAPSSPSKTDSIAKPITLIKSQSIEEEISSVVDYVKKIRTQYSSDTIGILIPTRTYANKLTKVLRDNGVSFISSQLTSISEEQAVLDLLSLWFSLTNTTDNLSWFSLLYSPLIGLNSQEIYDIKQSLDDGMNVGEYIIANLNELPDYNINFRNKSRLLKRLINNRYRVSDRRWLEYSWSLLKGDMYYSTKQKSIECIYKLLECRETKSLFSDREKLLEHIDSIYQQADNHKQTQVEILTIHKSKGLEFDHVIIPFSDKNPKRHFNDMYINKQLVYDGSVYDLFAFKEAASDLTPVYKFLKRHFSTLEANEKVRLFYVAMTRARRSLMLSGSSDESSKIANTYFDWTKDFIEPIISNPSHQDHEVSSKRKVIIEPFSDLESEYIHLSEADTIDAENKEWQALYLTGSETLLNRNEEAILGTVIHKLLENYGNIYHESIFSESSILQELKTHPSISSSMLPRLLNIVKEHLLKISNCPIGKWILTQYPVSKCEWRLPKANSQFYEECVIDRYFEDSEKRWIVDYKTAYVETEMEKHVQQLQTYLKVLHRFNLNNVSALIYFTDPTAPISAFKVDEKAGRLSPLISVT